MAEYPINKGVGRQVEFKGLRAQYLFLFAGGLLAVFILVVVLYMGGVDQVACLVAGVGLGGAGMPGQGACAGSGRAIHSGTGASTLPRGGRLNATAGHMALPP